MLVQRSTLSRRLFFRFLVLEHLIEVDAQTLLSMNCVLHKIYWKVSLLLSFTEFFNETLQ